MGGTHLHGIQKHHSSPGAVKKERKKEKGEGVNLRDGEGPAECVRGSPPPPISRLGKLSPGDSLWSAWRESGIQGPQGGAFFAGSNPAQAGPPPLSPQPRLPQPPQPHHLHPRGPRAVHGFRAALGPIALAPTPPRSLLPLLAAAMGTRARASTAAVEPQTPPSRPAFSRWILHSPEIFFLTKTG